MSRYVFPFSFQQKVHHAIPYLKEREGEKITKDWPHYTLDTPLGQVSVIGGDPVCHWGGDGIRTFEVWYPTDSDPTWHQTAAEIQQWLDAQFPDVSAPTPEEACAGS